MSCSLTPQHTLLRATRLQTRLISPRTQSRHESTALHFYKNKQLELYAAKEAKRLTLRQLVFFGRSMDEERLIKSANYVRTELPIRIAHRLRDLQSLPYVVVKEEGISQVYELYWDAFDKFRQYPPITNVAENEAFCKFLRSKLEEHSAVIPLLSLGISLASPHLPPEQLDAFMRRMLVSRISRRVLAEHHAALSEHYQQFLRQGTKSTEKAEPHVGIIFTGLNVKRSVEKCARILRSQQSDILQGKPWPDVIINGHTEATFAYIKEHLEYIVFELLKNSLRATAIKHTDEPVLPPVTATVVVGDADVGIRISDQGGGLFSPDCNITSPSDLMSFSHVRNAGRREKTRLGALRTVSASPTGMRATLEEQIGRWKGGMNQDEKTPETSVGVGLHDSIGIGLPMSNIFATYFGGSLEMVSLDGWGTDVYLRLPKLGTNLEGIEV